MLMMLLLFYVACDVKRVVDVRFDVRQHSL